MPISAGRHQIGHCMRCGFKYARAHLREDGRLKRLLVCAVCWDPDHPLDYPAPPRAEGLPPYKPSILTDLDPPVLDAEIVEAGVQVNWTAVDSNEVRIESYLLYRQVNDDDFVLIGTFLNTYTTFGALESQTLEYLDETSFSPGDVVSYYVVVTATDRSAQSNSDTVEFEDSACFAALKLMDPTRWHTLELTPPPANWELLGPTRYYWAPAAYDLVEWAGIETNLPLCGDVTVHWEVHESSHAPVETFGFEFDLNGSYFNSIPNPVATGSFVIPAGTTVTSFQVQGVLGGMSYGGVVSIWFEDA